MSIKNIMTTNQVKHLEMIQDIVDRMNRNSFQIKAVVAVILAGLMAMYARIEKTEVLFIGIAPVVLLWILDSFYLQTERKFLALYKEIVKNPTDTKYVEFDMPIGNYNTTYYSLISAMFYSINCLIYLTLSIFLFCLGNSLQS